MYSPNYHPQPTGPYQPAWSTQPLSPLPKQLSMLPPVVAQPPPHFEPEPKPEVQFVPELPSTSPRVSTLPTRPDVQLISPSTSALQPESSAKTTSESPMSSIPLSPKVKVSHAAPERPSTPTRPPSSSWVIWSRRPGDPSRAPGIIISPRAFPPEDVIQKALELPSPPVSPKPEVLELPLLQASALEDVHSVTGSPARAGVPSSSATEATTCSTTDTPVPGSPLSSTTSISVAAASPLSGSFAKLAISPKVEVNMEIATAEEMEVSATVTPSASGTTPVASSEAVPEAAAPASPPISTPAPTPSASTSKPSALKKSWASLLQSADATASSSKSRLPVSSVMGFSIPADSLSGSSIAPGATVAPSHREELLSLLSSGPSPSNTPLKVRPRGLINTGNLCFANAVLQTLVYCPPFHRLFSELRRYLAGPVAGSQKEGSNATPLVDATVQFLKEFVPDPPSAFLNHKSKGKEREDDNFDELDSFIPSYVYDAMKEKKRFANMIGGHQEDAEEFLGFFLDALEEELLSISNSLSPKDPKTAVDGPQSQPHQDDGWLEVGKRNRSAFTRTIKSTESPITRIFGGKFRSTLRTPHQRDSVTVEDWRSLRLDIQPEQVRTIKDALQHISHEQDVQISIPTRPGVVLDASQQSLIEALPPVLILHLKRFLYDTTVGDVVKVCKQVTFAPELEVGPDLIAPSQRTTQPVKYQLFGVIYHHGPSASEGTIPWMFSIRIATSPTDLGLHGYVLMTSWYQMSDLRMYLEARIATIDMRTYYSIEELAESPLVYR
ncbi:Ubiquitin carboxyl-terminal hydrolase 10 [Grifola frondosa]|uniref:ubiquitinyl hydrolase 1 n=1 Tax=Grifola frondosa TaxID=5627 RepID=A0A1C7LLU3_GRIFR|nr:Ubiquitin carboxyl-terminal hydrolase 10 [Grifola frondosa]